MRAGLGRRYGTFDAALRATFLREQRAVWAGTYFVHSLMLAGFMALFVTGLSYILSPRAAAIAQLAGAWQIVVLAIFASFTRSRWFAEARYAELVTFVALLPSILGLVYAGSIDEERTGWPAHTTLYSFVIIFISFSTFGFVANFRVLVMWFAVLIPVYVTWLFAIGTPAVPAAFNLTAVLMLAALAAFSNWEMGRQGLEIFELQRSLRSEQAKTERLLHTLVPSDIANRLKRGETVADPFPAATVVFIDIVGSSAFARQATPDRFIATLNAIFAIADRHAQLHRVEKVKTIGDAYLVVAGARGGGDAIGAAQFALGVIRDVAAFAAREDLPIGIRAGLHSGPVIGGVIGSERSIYDYWGDTMNTAARLESAARPNAIAVSEPVYRAVSRVAAFDPPRMVQLKGIGDFAVYDHAPELW